MKDYSEIRLYLFIVILLYYYIGIFEIEKRTSSSYYLKYINIYCINIITTFKM